MPRRVLGLPTSFPRATLQGVELCLKSCSEEKLDALVKTLKLVRVCPEIVEFRLVAVLYVLVGLGSHRPRGGAARPRPFVLRSVCRHECRYERMILRATSPPATSSTPP